MGIKWRGASCFRKCGVQYWLLGHISECCFHCLEGERPWSKFLKMNQNLLFLPGAGFWCLLADSGPVRRILAVFSCQLMPGTQVQYLVLSGIT